MFKIKDKCVLCNKEITDFLDCNNADPVADGVCCSDCNIHKVIPERVNKVSGRLQLIGASAIQNKSGSREC
jgi:hypothetical protein|tara:strand:+ start:145 stop:357 length:213 start_codon:yes stop_codon:yes gene_type:complete